MMGQAITSFGLATLAASALLATAGPVSADDGLWSALNEGGKVVLVRHAATEAAEPAVSLRLVGGDCASEQNLSAEGRAQAKRLGAAFRQRGVALETPLTSEYCRARETSKLAFGSYEAWNALNLSESMDSDDATFLIEDVRDRIGDYQGARNLVMVTHRSNINIISYKQTEPGDLVVMQSDGSGGFDVLGVIRAASY